MTLGVQDYLADQVVARPDVVAITDSTGVTLTYAGLDAASDEVIELLRDAGVQPADRVLLLSENSAAAVAVLFACWKMGARAVPVNARQTATEVARVVLHAQPAAERAPDCYRGRAGCAARPARSSVHDDQCFR